MDKGKIKLILIALAGLVVLFLLWKILNKTADSKLEASNKLNQANADLEIERMYDEYEEEVIEKLKGREEAKNELLSEKMKAEGIETLADYKATLSPEDIEKYDTLSSKYISATTKSPNLMTVEDLEAWNDKYEAWKEAADKYVRFGGDIDKISFLNEKTDEPREIDSIIMQKLIPEKNAMYEAEYSVFKNGSDTLAAIITPALVRKWLFDPTLLRNLKEELLASTTDWASLHAPFVNNLWSEIYVHFDQMKYVDRKRSGNIVRFNNLPEGILTKMRQLTKNQIAYLNILANNGILIPTEVKSNELKGKSKIYMRSITDILEGVASCRAQSNGKSPSAKEDYMWQNYKDARTISKSVPASEFTPYGYTKTQLVNNFIQFAIDSQSDFLTQEDVEMLMRGDKNIIELLLDI